MTRDSKDNNYYCLSKENKEITSNLWFLLLALFFEVHKIFFFSVNTKLVVMFTNSSPHKYNTRYNRNI